MPNRHPLTARLRTRPESSHARNSISWRPNGGRHVSNWRGGGPANARVSLSSILFNWAGLVALWALPYLTLLDHLRLDAARSETLQWSLLVIGALGLVSLLYTSWKQTLDPAWRARHGLTLRKRSARPRNENVA
jgi:hypothetical protein